HEDYASGGMITKIEAARIATHAGCHMAICDGRILRPIKAVMEGQRATWFIANENPPQARKIWIAGGLQPQGKIHLDHGAVKALRQGKSLLAAGITHVDGQFERGDLIMAPIIEPKLVRPVYLVRNPAKPMTRASQELERITHDVIRDLVSRGIWQTIDK
ncbi:MAG: hypothetical protein EBR13_07260, partial [Rhodobacteraceae bacterium]|nr:hypothetical protein [Paracoccaceae bacterium]